MTEAFKKELILNETDLDGALYRVNGDEDVYEALLRAFASDKTMDELENAIATHSWDEAFTAAHALKGTAGNMGFAPLFHNIGELVILIRAGRIDEIDLSLRGVKRCYIEIMETINRHCHE